MKNYAKVEQNIATSINALKNCPLPKKLPQWLIKNGIEPGAIIESAQDVGASGPNSKTDVIVYLKNSSPLKISVKKDNADYYGNWYGHKKIDEIFSKQIFDKLTKETTKWANEVLQNNTLGQNKPFVGVSISFGKRTGHTKLKFRDIFEDEDILTIAKGSGNPQNTNVANSLIFTTNGCINNVQDLINSLKEITIPNILDGMNDFYIIFRPVNPMTEKSNRAKNIYTRFKPCEKSAAPTHITKLSQLKELGKFETVPLTITKPMMTHNYVLNDLENNYNIIIPRKN